MGKEEIKAVSAILASKVKTRRALKIIGLVLGMVLVSVIIIAGIAFYTGAVSYHGGVK